ncbi:unnamed protein product [Moneuplotes crassus]|uniref:Uncharacterized protein n=1 Tax=Euplotes crassus TaxID=5936 RepID=A0AAD1U7E2_EUPCR|nr:unnamed protein product [Moneuplotes crassus]
MSDHYNSDKPSKFSLENQNLRKIYSKTEIDGQVPKNMQELNTKLKNFRLFLDGQDYIISPKARTKNRHITFSHELNNLIKLKNPKMHKDFESNCNSVHATNVFLNVTQIAKNDGVKLEEFIPKNKLSSRLNDYLSQERDKIIPNQQIMNKLGLKMDSKILKSSKLYKNRGNNYKPIGKKEMKFKSVQQRKQCLERILNTQLKNNPNIRLGTNPRQKSISTENRDNRNMTLYNFCKSSDKNFTESFHTESNLHPKNSGKIIHGSNVKSKNTANPTTSLQSPSMNYKNGKPRNVKMEEKLMTPILTFAPLDRNCSFSINHHLKRSQCQASDRDLVKPQSLGQYLNNMDGKFPKVRWKNSQKLNNDLQMHLTSQGVIEKPRKSHKKNASKPHKKPPRMFKIKVTTSNKNKLFIKDNSKDVHSRDRCWSPDMKCWSQGSDTNSSCTFETKKL